MPEILDNSVFLTMKNFPIVSGQLVSKTFLNQGIKDFEEACNFIASLPYRRNRNKTNILAALTEGCGTCSTKHAILQQLADENGQTSYQLVIGIFKMNATNTPKLASVLAKYGLDYLPEAHNYLRFEGKRLDFTTSGRFIDFEPYLLEEMCIKPHQITDFKVDYHKNFLEKWRQDNTSYSLDELWAIREECIRALAG